jgi:hypothetical protein
VSDYDVKHRWVTSFNYALPFTHAQNRWVSSIAGGWQVGSILVVQSGLPFSPSISTDPANTGTSLRPNRVASGALSDRSIYKWFDTSAFQLPAAYTYGNSGRNILYGPGFFNWDAVLMRDFAIKERLRLQLRGEFFNVTNTPAFGNPVTNIQASNAGQILSAGEPRDVQAGLKLIF